VNEWPCDTSSAYGSHRGTGDMNKITPRRAVMSFSH
jgi:hypothetical protein